MRWQAVTAALAAATLLVTTDAGPVSAQEETIVRFASVGGITDAPIYLAEAHGLFKQAKLNVQIQRMTSAPNLITATATNQLDVAGISITPGLFSSIQQGLKLRVVGDKQSLRPGFSATRLMVRSDLVQGDPAATIRSLKGKTVAVSARASSVTMLLRDLLDKHGMTLTDIRLIELSYPNMLPALTSKAVDAVINLEPFLSQAVQAGAATVVDDLTAYVPAEGATIVPLVYGEEFAAKRDAASAFMKAYLQGVRIYNDALLKNKDKDKMIEIVAQGARVDPKVVRDGMPAGLDPNQKVSAAFFDELQDFFVEQRVLRSKIDVNQLIDPTFARAAVEQLGVYR